MMFELATEFLLAFVVSIVLVLVLGATGRRGPWRWTLAAFLLIFLFTWTAGVWARPGGPLMMGVAWAPFVFFGLIMALIIAAAAPPNRRKRVEDTPAPDARELEGGGVGLAVGALFWLAIVGLVIALGVYYI